MEMNMDLLNKWLTLDEKKRRLKAELTATQNDLDDIEGSVIDQLIASKTKRISIDGRTMYIACDRYPKVKGDRAALLAAMKENGLGSFVKEDFNSNSLRGVMGDWLEAFEAELTDEQRAIFTANDAIPEAFRDVLEYSETLSVRSRKS